MPAASERACVWSQTVLYDCVIIPSRTTMTEDTSPELTGSVGTALCSSRTVAVVVFNGQHKVEFANPAAQSLIESSRHGTGIEKLFAESRDLLPGGKTVLLHVAGDTQSEAQLYKWWITAAGGKTFIALGVDLADQTRSDDVLQEREALLSSIIDTVPGAVITIDEMGVIQSFSASAERTFGYLAAEIIGSKINVLMPDPYRAEHDGYMESYKRTGVKKIIGIGRVVVAQRKDGSTFPIELSVGEMRIRNKRLFVGVVRDITAKGFGERQIHQLQTQLLQASRLTGMGEMSSALAHELNQPISAIMSYADAALHLLGSNVDPKAEKIREIIGKAAAQARRAGQIVHHLRQFVLTGEGEKTQSDLNAVIQDSLAMAMIGSPPIEPQILLKLKPALPPALIDRVQIQQVLVNIIKNAIEALAGTPQPEIIIETTVDLDGQLKVSISDNGPGLNAGVMERMFHPFVTTKTKGMGMGLSICRSIIENHGGKISAENARGGGAKFVFTVPSAQETNE